MPGWFDAVFGRILSRGVELELEGGLNVLSPLKAARNAEAGTIDISIVPGDLAGAAVPLSTALYVDSATAVPIVNQTGSIAAPFATLTDALAEAATGHTILVNGDFTGEATPPSIDLGELHIIGMRPADRTALAPEGIPPAPFDRIPALAAGNDVQLSLQNLSVNTGVAFTITTQSALRVTGCAGIDVTGFPQLLAADSSLGDLEVAYFSALNCGIGASSIDCSETEIDLAQCQFAEACVITFTDSAGVVRMDLPTYASWLAAGGSVDNGTVSVDGVAAFALTLLDDASAAAMRETLGAAARTDLQIFTASGTYTIPTTAVAVRVDVQSPGGGGGSGRRGATTSNRSGGGGGGGGGNSSYTFSGAALRAVAASTTVTVGTAGVGGAAQTTNSTDGTAATAGTGSGNSIGGQQFMRSGAGGPGAGGGATAGTAGTAGVGQTVGIAGAAGSNGAGAAAGSNSGAPGGGGGGGVNTSDTPAAGGTGGASTTTSTTLAAGGTADGGAGTNGTSSAGLAAALPFQAGGGGGGGLTASGGVGGNGGSYGCGGGGGGAGTDSVGAGSGKGGDGGPGLTVYTAFG